MDVIGVPHTTFFVAKAFNKNKMPGKSLFGKKWATKNSIIFNITKYCCLNNNTKDSNPVGFYGTYLLFILSI